MSRTSPGWARLQAHENIEELRQDTLRMQREALAAVRERTEGPADQARDRAAPAGRDEYPKPKRRRT